MESEAPPSLGSLIVLMALFVRVMPPRGGAPLPDEEVEAVATYVYSLSN